MALSKCLPAPRPAGGARAVRRPAFLRFLVAAVAAVAAGAENGFAPAPAPAFVGAEAPGAVSESPGPAMGSPAPADWAPAPAPMPGANVAQTVSQRIDEDSRKIGSIAENLVNVQGDMNRVEKEVLGKVFDMQSMKNFFNTHMLALDQNKKLQSQDQHLSNEVVSLTNQLTKAHKDTMEQDATHNTRMSQMHVKVVEDEAVIQGLVQDLRKEKTEEAESGKLQNSNADIRAQTSKTVAATDEVQHAIDSAKDQFEKSKETTNMLAHELVTQHSYSEQCHGRSVALEQRLNALLTTRATARVKSKGDMKKVSNAGMTAQKELAQQNEILKTRLVKARKNSWTFQSQHAATLEQTSALQHEGQGALTAMREALGKMRVQVEAVEATLMKHEQERQIVEAHVHRLEDQVNKVQQVLLGGKLAQLRSRNTQLKADMLAMQQGLQSAHAAQAIAQGDAMRAKQEELVAQQEAAGNAAQAQSESEKMMQEVAATKKKADDEAQVAEAATMEAEASQLMDCKVIWDKKHPEINEELKECEQTKLDLESTSALLASMKETIKSA